MASEREWALAFARQADADLRGYERLEEFHGALSAECHQMLLLQMACEKVCKAHLLGRGSEIGDVTRSHGYVAKNLPVIIKQEMINREMRRASLKASRSYLQHLSQEIEILNPAIKRGARRPDNCEYPWDVGGKVVSPLDWSFVLAQLCILPSGRLFLKLLRSAIDSVLQS